ncbi:radical SAM protein [Clostridiaceae bacterium M8S5]|nr:radical SAM protein [Clostridiaceae bacterium M8S5]
MTYDNNDLIFRREFFGGLVISSNGRCYYGDMVVRKIIEHQKLDDELITQINKQYGLSKGEVINLYKSINRNCNIRNMKILKNLHPKNFLTAPLRVFYDITYKCNLHCKHCYTDSGNKNKVELDWNDKIKLIDNMVDMGIKKLSIAGGEPFISNKFLYFLQYASSKEINISFTTNSLFINSTIISELNKLNIQTITVSLDGATSETNDYIRGEGTYNKVVKQTSMLSKKFIGDVALRMTIMKHNLNEWKKFIELASILEVEKVKFNCIRETGRASLNSELLISQNEYIEFIKQVAKHEISGVKVSLPVNPFSNCEYDIIDELGFGCSGGKDSITVAPDGTVKPCSQLVNGDANIKEKSLSEIWQTSKLISEFRNLEGNNICRSCEIYDKCRAGCRYRALRYYNNINEIDPFCYKKLNLTIDESRRK